jgi:flagellum-specific peptidoglycan hydrolase FlgJ
VQAINIFKGTLEPIASQVQKETGISARLGIIQASLESFYGSSDLSRPGAKLTILPAQETGPALNLFGFKTGEAWMKAGKPYVLVPTMDYYRTGQKLPDGTLAPTDNFMFKWPAPFRVYNSWDESYRDWARLMQTAMYVNDGTLEALKNDDLTAFGKALSVHYAPNQNYDARLTSRAEVMNLV